MKEDENKLNSPASLSPMDEQAESGQEGRLELDLRNRPTGVRAICLVNMAGQPIIRLLVQGTDGRTLMDSSQDLEDTLALGAFIVETTADILEDLVKLLKDGAWQKGIGEDFESFVAQTETATRRIREQLSVVEPS